MGIKCEPEMVESEVNSLHSSVVFTLYESISPKRQVSKEAGCANILDALRQLHLEILKLKKLTKFSHETPIRVYLANKSSAKRLACLKFNF